MATTITMPQLGESVTEGTVAQWLKKIGDRVEKYEAFVEVSTDKVNAEVPSPVAGIIRELIVPEGETVPTGSPIAVIDEVGANAAAPVRQTPAPVPLERVAAERDPAHAEADRMGSDEPVPGGHGTPAHAPAIEARTGSTNGSQPSAPNGTAASNGTRPSPAVRRLAREHAVDPNRVSGTGTHGRVTADDILAAAKAGPGAATAVPAAAPAGTRRSTYAAPIPGELIALTPARKIIAQRMVESKHTAPHAWTMVEVDVTNVWKWRAREKEAFERATGARLTLLPFFMRAVVESLHAFPLMNASFQDTGILVHGHLNLGIAIAVEANLLVPVIRHAEELSIRGLALAAGAIIEKARRGKLGPDDLSGGTFTVNNTGANGSVLSAPILVAGQAGIVTMEAVVKRAVVRDDDSIAVRSMMNVCLSLDHRVVDGAIASGFLFDLKQRLEAMGPTGTL